MKRDEFEAVVAETLGRLPGWVHENLDNIEVLVVDEPDEVFDTELEGGDAAATDTRDLLGLYVGLPLPERDANHAGELPDVIYIFRRPHLDLGLPPDELRDEIATTLIHEIAHYFGIDDDHLDEIGWG